jgi:catechol 2,3-dioxygenase-like lactoylglutathione lyase family enzyme
MIKRDNANAGFEFGGINHVALVCADMAKTVDFCSGVLGMPLVMASTEFACWTGESADRNVVTAPREHRPVVVRR